MAPFSIPAPSVVPLRTPLFGGPRAIDTQTKIELMCDTYLAHEIYYTLDGTKPQPYAGIIQGSKLHKYKSPFCLPAGKITLKAIALSSHIHSMQSSVVTKYFEVIKTESDTETKRYFEKSKKKKSSKVLKKKKNTTDLVPLTESNACKENIDIMLDESSNNCCRENGTDGLNDFPPDLEIFPEDDVSESLSEIPSFASGSNKTEELNGDNFEIQKTPLITPSPPLTESELTSQEKGENFDTDGFKRQYDVEEEDGLLKIDKKLPTCAVSAETPTYCMKCDKILQFCRSCSSLNAVTSQYCMHCGEKLMQRCCNCKELNSVTGTFCHCCGRKLEIDNKELQISYTDHCVMVEPQKMHASVQQTPSTVSKETQTLSLPKERSRNTDAKRIPSHSPGRGYWHQQLDYICNHLKSYAYNNLEFRNSISEPMLNDFQNAQITKTDDIVNVTISFSSFVKEKKESKDLN
ncbi:double zinc ribbon and ankyrin repeat-containing protein 1-like [Argiope bruennichi]|nr:double zinc ribbon and ankyrin repeat-containing protein 1-like [Argiope bruennichi]